MVFPGRSVGSILLSLFCAITAPPVAAAGQPSTVVELFTSQGCSSCPPANANLIKVSNLKNVLALSFSVTYWDYLGWKDTFGKPEFTERQVTYEPALGQAGPFTPQMVVNGAFTVVGNELTEIDSLLGQVAPLEGPPLALRGNRIDIGKGAGPGNADVWLVRYDPRTEAVPVSRGENGGATLQHTHVVHNLKRLGTWNGSKISFSLPGTDAGLRTAVLVQRPDGGPILSAITD